MIFVSAFDRPIRCFLAAQCSSGLWARLLGRALGLIPDHGDASSLEAACLAADRGEALLAFAELEKSSLGGDPRNSPSGRGVQLAAELVKRPGDGSRLAVVPVHIFLPRQSLRAFEILIHLEPPVRPEPEAADRPASAGPEGTELTRRLDSALGRNAFRLRPADLRDFLADVEQVLRQDLESKPVRPPERRLALEGFVLSEFLVEWAEQQNQLDPARLVALRTELDSLRERRRAGSLREIEAETSEPWARSAWKRSLAWAETIAGFPVAVFGLVNSAAALVALKIAGLAEINKQTENTRRWLERAGIVLVIFALQILVCDWRWGRPAAGLYAASLPVSAFYVWRFRWLFAHKTRLLFWGISSSRVRARLDQQRGKWLRDLSRAQAA